MSIDPFVVDIESVGMCEDIPETSRFLHRLGCLRRKDVSLSELGKRFSVGLRNRAGDRFEQQLGDIDTGF